MPIQGIFKPTQIIMTMKVGTRGFIPAEKIICTEKFFRIPIEAPVGEIYDDYFQVAIERIGPGMTGKDYNLIFEENLDQRARYDIYPISEHDWIKIKESEVVGGFEIPNYKDSYVRFKHSFEEIRDFLNQTFILGLKIMTEEQLENVRKIYETDGFYDLMPFIDNELEIRKKKQ